MRQKISARAALVRALASAVVAASLGAAAPAHANEQADAFFKVGASAYKAGRFVDAVEAFQQAQRLAPTPGLLFSLGQANRMEHAARKDPSRLAEAVRWYEAYLAADPTGKRAMEATEYLSRLRPMLAIAGAVAAAAPTATAAPPSKPRVMISSPTPGVRLFFDDQEVAEPFIAEVAPGKHALRLEAPGFASLVREIEVDAANGAPPLDLELKALAAQLAVDGSAGAEVSVDGFYRGTLPLPPLALAAGRHVVRVTRNGGEPFEETVTLERGARRSLRAELRATGQRKAGVALLAAGSAGVIAGGILAGLAYATQREAQDLLAATREVGNQPPDVVDRYANLEGRRDQLRLGAVIATGAGGGLAGLATLLLVFDRPAPTRSLSPVSDEATDAPVTPPTMDVSLSPIVGPGLAAGSLRVRF